MSTIEEINVLCAACGRQSKFGPGNGRYTLRLKIKIRGKYTDAELAQLYDTLNK